METEEKVSKRSRKLLIAAALFPIVACLAVWMSHLVSRSAANRVDAALRSQLGEYELPEAKAKRSTSNRVPEPITYSRFHWAIRIDLLPDTSLCTTSDPKDWGKPFRGLTSSEVEALRRYLGDLPQRTATFVSSTKNLYPKNYDNECRHLLLYHVIHCLKHNAGDEALQSLWVLMDDAWWKNDYYIRGDTFAALWHVIESEALDARQLRLVQEKLLLLGQETAQSQPFSTTRAAIRLHARSFRESTRLNWRALEQSVLFMDRHEIGNWIRDSKKRIHYRFWKSYEHEAELLMLHSTNVSVWQRGLANGNLRNEIWKAWKWRDQRLEESSSGYTVRKTEIYNRPRDIANPLILGILRATGRETVRRLSLAAIAIRRHEIEHHALPETLEELVSSDFKEVPIDPMDGKPLKYHRMNENRFRLYSVGWNRLDESGQTGFRSAKTLKDWMDGDDWVWPRKATAIQEERIRKERHRDTALPLQKKFLPHDKPNDQKQKLGEV